MTWHCQHWHPGIPGMTFGRINYWTVAAQVSSVPVGYLANDAVKRSFVIIERS
jgi:hypothetical protein